MPTRFCNSSFTRAFQRRYSKYYHDNIETSLITIPIYLENMFSTKRVTEGKNNVLGYLPQLYVKLISELCRINFLNFLRPVLAVSIWSGTNHYYSITVHICTVLLYVHTVKSITIIRMAEDIPYI